MSTSKSHSITAHQLGDAFHVLNIVGIIAYGTSIYLWSEGDLFDEEWLQEGFCLPHRDVPFWTTHDVSGYVLISISFLGLVVLHVLKDTSHKGDRKTSTESDGIEMARTLAFWALIGAIGHGAGHFLISHAKRGDYFPEGHLTAIDKLRGESLWTILARVSRGYLLFWVPLVKTYMINASLNKLALIALLVQFGAFQVPVRFGFAYTQMVLFAGLSLDQLLFVPDNKKGFVYAVWPLITVIPTTAFSWMESTRCTTSLLLRNYGHAVYDCFMVSSFILYYLICWIGVKNKILHIKLK